MKSITISKNEYEELRARATAYEHVVVTLQKAFAMTPPERSRKKIISEFGKTGKYNKNFLASLERGLSRSSYFKS